MKQLTPAGGGLGDLGADLGGDDLGGDLVVVTILAPWQVKTPEPAAEPAGDEGKRHYWQNHRQAR